MLADVTDSSLPLEYRLDDEERAIVQSFRGIAKIRILQAVASGKSKSKVYVVDVEPASSMSSPREADSNTINDDDLDELIRRMGSDPSEFDQKRRRELTDYFLKLRSAPSQPAGPAGIHYLKIHLDDNEAETLQEVIALNDTVISAKIVAFTVHRHRLAVLYKPAQQTLNPKRVAPLTKLIKDEPDAAQQSLVGLAHSLTQWKSRPIIEPFSPYDLLCQLLGPRRVSGDESAGQRMKRLLSTFDMATQAEHLLDTPVMKFANSTHLLPNPIAFLEHPEGWQTETPFQTITVQLGRSHGDLHAENIMCSYGAPPDMIDFSTFRKDQAIYFDLAYLEFDLLMRVCQPEKPENRQYLAEIVEHLTHKDDLGLFRTARSVGPLGSVVLNLIRPLREAVNNLFDRTRQEYSEITFWLCATAVGLNFTRKMTISPYDRLLGLLYAGAALRNVLSLLDIDYGTGDPISIDWPEKRASVFAETTNPDDVIGMVAQFIKDGHDDVVFLCGPGETLIDPDVFLEDLRKRLTWTDYTDVEDDLDIENVETLDQAIEHYRHFMSDINLRKAIQAAAYRAAANGPVRLVPFLAALGAHRKVSVVTFDWDETLDQHMARWAGTASVGDRVLHLCGCPSRPVPIHWLDRLSMSGEDVSQEKARLSNLLLGRLRSAKLIFLGSQPLNHPGWKEIIGDPLQKRDLKWRIWMVSDDNPAPPNHELERLSMALVPYDPVAFMQNLVERLHPDCDPCNPPALPRAPRHKPREYEPKIIDQDRWIDYILDSTRQQWIIYEEPGAGKSALVRKLAKSNTWRMRQFMAQGDNADPDHADEALELPFSLVVDFAAGRPGDPGSMYSLAAQHRGILHLMFDHFNCPIPDLRDDPRYHEYNSDKKVEVLVERFADAPVLAAPGGPYAGFWLQNNEFVRAEVLLCFDGLHVIGDNRTTEWLCREVAPVLVSRSKEAPQAARAHFKIVITRRKHPRPPLDVFLQQWNFHQAKVEPLGIDEAVEMLEDYVQNAAIPDLPNQERAREAILNVIRQRPQPNGPTNGERQAERYITVSGGDTYALKALVCEHARLGYVNMGYWPSEHDEPDIQRDVILPAALELLFDTLRYDPERAQLEKVYQDIFLCRRVSRTLLHHILIAMPEGENLHAMELVNRLDMAGLITYDSNYTGDRNLDWYLTSPPLHRVLRRGLRLTDRERFVEVSLVAYHFIRDQMPNIVGDSIWGDMFVDMLYYYGDLYDEGALDDGTPAQVLNEEIEKRFDSRGFDRLSAMSELRRLYDKAFEAGLAESLREAIRQKIEDTRNLSGGGPND
jgi:hypothetical protein